MSYIKHGVNLSENQLSKLRSAAKSKQAVKIRIDPTLKTNHQLYLTATQINKLKDGKPHDLNFSKTQLVKNGGFVISVPLLLAGIGAAASAATAASNIAKTVQAKKAAKKRETEQKRHHAAIETYLKAKGQGVFLPSMRKKGKGAYIPKKQKK